MNQLEKSIAVGILHDGTISSIEKTSNNLIMKVSISYLANIIDPKFEFFTYHFLNCESCYFVHWETNIRTDNVTEISEMNIEINESEPDGDFIKIFCIRERMFNGGYLYIKADHIRMYDHTLNEITYEGMREISKRYWKRI